MENTIVCKKADVDVDDIFYFEMETKFGKVAGNFEKSRLRSVVEIIDNAIHH